MLGKESLFSGLREGRIWGFEFFKKGGCVFRNRGLLQEILSIVEGRGVVKICFSFWICLCLDGGKGEV